VKALAEKARAKLNLTLDVLGARPDGYHDILTVMQSVSFCDDVLIALTEDGVLRLRTGLPYLPVDERNVAVRAAHVFLEAAGLSTGADIELIKRIPVGAGLGGGSADAAAVLRGLNRLTGAGFPSSKLEELASLVGSDVPFCIRGGAALAAGRGEKLTPLPPLSGCPVVICKPAFPLSTPKLFARVGGRSPAIRPDTEGLVRAMEENDTARVARRLFNVFEELLPKGCGEIAVIRSRLLDLGAMGAAMSGTGSAVFGLFRDRKTAKRAWEELSPTYRECFLTETAGRAM
jgi:4-diphosphocytidyl-2-C-methyl-D-erythritol kinase